MQSRSLSDFVALSSVSTLVLALSFAPADAQTQLAEIRIESAQAGGIESKAVASGGAVSVVTREEIERRQIRHAGDALRSLPGVSLNTSGGTGTKTELRLRGSEASHTKVLIDGVEVNGMDFGLFDFSTLLAADIERIEVLRGPQSGIHGGNALAGVVNIVTKKGGKPQVSFTGEGGSLNTNMIAANMSTGNEDGYVSVSGARKETGGFNIARTGSEEDGSEQATIFARAGYAFSPIFRMDGMLRHQQNDAVIDSDTDIDGEPNDVAGYSSGRSQNLGSLSGTLTLFDGAWVQKVEGSFFADDYEFKSLPSLWSTGLYTNEGDRSKFSYLSQFNLVTGALKHTLSGLTDHTEESFTNSFITGDRARGQTGYVAQYRLNWQEQFHLDGNVRFDDNDQFDDTTTYRIGASYLFSPTDSRLHASYGKGIQNPTMFQLFGSADQFNSNPNLLPEESLGFDVGVEQGFLNHRLMIDATYFESDLTNKISSTRVAGVFTPINLAGLSHRKGIELAAGYALTDTLTLGGSYTYTLATDPSGLEELRRPEHEGGVNVAWTFLDGRGRLNAEALYRGDVVDFDWGTSPPTRVGVGAHTVVNLAASYQLTDNVELFARGENLFNTDYEEIHGYETAPLTAYAGVKLKLDGGE